MATAEQRARRSAQRATAKAVRESRRTGHYPHRVALNIRQSVKKGQEDYGRRVLAGEEPRPPKRTAEGNELARLASWSSRNNSDPRFEAAFKAYWYHHKKNGESEADIEDSADYEGDEEDEEELCS